MSELLLRTDEVLSRAAEALADSPWGPSHAAQFAELRARLRGPCYVAVCGEVKTGKSSLVNALLGQDRAPVGVVETTATQIRFIYGTPQQDGQVKCYWHDGRVEDSSLEFLQKLQGNDPKVLQDAKQVRYFEILVHNSYLRDIILVDTPGVNAVVEEHQKAAEKAILEEAAAIIYFTRYVASERDQQLVGEFQKLSGRGGLAMNALGVMGQIDIDAGVLQRRHELASHLESSMAGVLFKVVAVSSALYQATRDEEALAELRGQLLQMPQLDEMLDGDEIFISDEWDDLGCPFSVDERRAMVRRIGPAFRVVARALSQPDRSVGELRAMLLEQSGFQDLDNVLRHHFMARAQILQCSSVLEKAGAFFNELRNRQYKSYENLLDRDAAQVAAVREAIGKLAPELQTGLKGVLSLDGVKEKLGKTVAELEHLLDEINRIMADFRALKLLHEHAKTFSAEEFRELRFVLGEHGLGTMERLKGLGGQSVEDRQNHWQNRIHGARRQIKDVIARAVSRYGTLHSLGSRQG